ncbi:MAG: UMP kinase [Pseudomonadota bacterium]
MSEEPAYKRVLVKLSGEALLGNEAYGIDPEVLDRVADELVDLHALGVEVALVIGAGNIFRGAGLAQGGMERVTGDHIGMLGTVINALAMQDALEQRGLYVRVMSALEIEAVCENYLRRRAIRHLEKRRIVVFAAGTGNPFFTTDSAASLRAIEIGAELMIKATKVDGVYTEDPVTNPAAERYERLDYDEVLRRGLNVMDQTAVVLCRDHGMRMRVLDMGRPDALKQAVLGHPVGTLVERAS